MFASGRSSFKALVKPAVPANIAAIRGKLSGSARPGLAAAERLNSTCASCPSCAATCNRRSVTTQASSSKSVVKSAGASLAFGRSDRLVSAAVTTNCVELTLASGARRQLPTTWLRDNCQCDDCFNHVAKGRSLLMQHYDVNPGVSKVSITTEGQLDVEWEGGHRSRFHADWLLDRGFDEEARRRYRAQFQLPKTQWTTGHSVAKFDFRRVMADEKALLAWLVAMETEGASLLQNVPSEPPAAYDLCERVAKVKYTHFGDYSNVINHPNPNNLAYTGQSLNLHNDMPQYQEIPGLIFLHMIKQHSGEGGDTIISDGFRAANQMRIHHPEHFKILTSTDVYFWDEGLAKDALEPYNFYKINKGPTIELDNRGEVSIIRFNNQVRDAHLDLDADKVNDFYAAMKTYFNYMYENSVSYKMQAGDMTVLDNVRCQHGRAGFHGNDEARHLVTTFMTWDEARCRRRRLQEEFGAQ